MLQPIQCHFKEVAARLRTTMQCCYSHTQYTNTTATPAQILPLLYMRPAAMTMPASTAATHVQLQHAHSKEEPTWYAYTSKESIEEWPTLTQHPFKLLHLYALHQSHTSVLALQYADT